MDTILIWLYLWYCISLSSFRSGISSLWVISISIIILLHLLWFLTFRSKLLSLSWLASYVCLFLVCSDYFLIYSDFFYLNILLVTFKTYNLGSVLVICSVVLSLSWLSSFSSSFSLLNFATVFFFHHHQQYHRHDV